MEKAIAAAPEAERTGRRVLLIVGGPRCGPCFTLARWVERQHAAIARDYVIVKVMKGVDDLADAVLAGLPIQLGEGSPGSPSPSRAGWSWPPASGLWATSASPARSRGFVTSEG